MDEEIINCQNKFNTSFYQNINQTANCGSVWDGVYCWPPTVPNTTVQMKCSDIFAAAIEHFQHYSTDDYMKYFAYRKCSDSGHWDWNSWTNYTECLTLLALQDENISRLSSIKQVLNYIVLTCSLCSLVALVIALIIFTCFKSIQCTRIRVHKNLCIALLMNCCLLIVMSSPVVVDNASLPQIDWLCKSLKALNIYSLMATILWMFNEGLLLHTRLYVSPFKSNTNSSLAIYYIIGWIFPALSVLLWAMVLEFALDFESHQCWQGYGKSKTIFIVTGPMLALLVINTGFLINIIRILFVKLKHDNNRDKVTSKTIKATALLIPLLGIQHLLFCINPSTFNLYLESFYIIINGLIQSVQGITVTILYCFTNHEVRAALNSAWSRRRISHNFGLYSSSKKRRQSSASSTSMTLAKDKVLCPLFYNQPIN
ncbi:calcitonin gene-related peptide type 1 receptor-like [Oppia nitens]|uniref:calcitonin gene-related peptide type 1 receptor-like n=1 Tax=Oppia nitens TaxID=1686743 RepID=UPI0023DC836F|nr:calcitonin gene-related peptide type 1 receptor-like [Oppia nitens]